MRCTFQFPRCYSSLAESRYKTSEFLFHVKSFYSGSLSQAQKCVYLIAVNFCGDHIYPYTYVQHFLALLLPASIKVTAVNAHQDVIATLYQISLKHSA